MKRSLLASIICLAFASNVFAAAGGKSAEHKPLEGSKGKSAEHKPLEGTKGKSAEKAKKAKVDKEALKACIDPIKQQLADLRPQQDTACADEASAECVALKEQISAIKAQLKECRVPAEVVPAQ